nr:hypothetical protein [Streptomyces sp. HNM0574]
MGWTHDYRDVARKRSFTKGRVPVQGTGPSRGEHSPAGPGGPPAPGMSELDIPRILRRRARWVGARLRHTRG